MDFLYFFTSETKDNFLSKCLPPPNICDLRSSYVPHQNLSPVCKCLTKDKEIVYESKSPSDESGLSSLVALIRRYYDSLQNVSTLD